MVTNIQNFSPSTQTDKCQIQERTVPHFLPKQITSNFLQCPWTLQFSRRKMRAGAMATAADEHIDVIPGTRVQKKGPSQLRALQEGSQRARSRWLLQLRAGSYKPEGKSEPGWGTDWWDHWVLGWKSAQEHRQPERYMLFLFLALYIFICNLLSSFPFVFLSKLIFALPLPVSKCLFLLSSIFYPFPTLVTESFLASLFISFFRLLFLSLWPWGGWYSHFPPSVPLHGCFHVCTIPKRRIDTLASLWKFDLEMG